MQLCNFAMVPTIKPITEHMEMDMAKTVWVLGANGRLGLARPGIQQITAQPQVRVELLDVQPFQRLTAFRPR